MTAGTVILLVDDDDDVRTLFLREAQQQQVEVVAARDGREAIAIARAHRLSVIVLDIGLPELDGRDVLVRLRNDPATRDVPIVAISGYFDDIRRMHLLELGAVDCIEKPLRLKSLLRKLLLLADKPDDERGAHDGGVQEAASGTVPALEPKSVARLRTDSEEEPKKAVRRG